MKINSLVIPVCKPRNPLVFSVKTLRMQCIEDKKKKSKDIAKQAIKELIHE